MERGGAASLVAAALVGLVLTAPLMVTVALRVQVESRRPILYAPLMVGRFIRNRSLDHRPMLIKLLRGDLTLVDPRRWCQMRSTRRTHLATWSAQLVRHRSRRRGS